MAYPTDLPTHKTDFANATPVVDTHPDEHNEVAVSVNALAAKVGINSSAVTTSHDYKLSGVTGSDKAVSLAGTETLTNKTLTSPALTSPTTSGTDTGTATLTNKTLTRPKVGTSLDDTNGNEIIETPATASAVNHLKITNAATGNDALIDAVGDDTNVGIKIKGKGTGKVKLGDAELQFPDSDGTIDQVIKTDGSGVLSFVTQESGESHFYGDGVEGALSATGATTINSVTTTVDALSSSGGTTLNVASTTSFSVGDHILIHQSQGTGTGLWEVGKIASISAGVSFTLEDNLANSYQSTGAQVLLMPEYTTATFKTGASLTVTNWAGSSGGIVAFYASRGVLVEEGVTLSLVGEGFRGGAAGSGAGTDGTQGEGESGTGSALQTANGMGGGGADGAGANQNGAGGGGAKAGGAGSGSAAGGQSFVDALSTYITGSTYFAPILLFGGGGGGSADSGSSGDAAGGNGGGIILIISPSIRVIGTINAKGATANGTAEDGGNGGSGTIALFGEQIIGESNCNISAETSDNGGDGGEGTLLIGYPSSQLPTA